MRPRRKYDRFVRRLELEFSVGGKVFRGLSSDFSCNGLFIRTNHVFPSDTLVNITLSLPDQQISRLTGIVKRAMNTQLVGLKNGMGIEITSADDLYISFMSTFSVNCREQGSLKNGTAEPEKPAPEIRDNVGTAASETVLILCRNCGVKNRIPKTKISLGPKCGKCGAALIPDSAPDHEKTTIQPIENPRHLKESVRSTVPSPEGLTYSAGDLIAGRYQIQDIFGGEGKSAMGIVYMCYDLEYDQVLALKTLQQRYLDSKKIVDSFKKEALAWIYLGKHPYIVRAYWVRELDGHMFIACEFITPDAAGRNSVTPYLKSPFSLKRVLTWAIQFCHGMEYACARGVTPHRDIKPDNIMITMDGDVKITDFGLAGLWDKANQPEEIKALIQKDQKGLAFLSTYNNRIVAGSPPWMAPEQFYGVAEVRSDIYSFGMVLFQLINMGELPFQPHKGDTWRITHKEYPLPPIPKQGKVIAHIVTKCLEKRRDRRYTDFGELRRDLEEVFRKEITRKTGETIPLPPKLDELHEAELINKGMSLANLGLIEEGIKNYRESLKLNPKNPSAHYNLGNALAQKGLLGEAIREYKEAISIDPDLTSAHFNLGIALFKKGQLEDAIREYKYVIRINPDFGEAYVNLGVALHKKGSVDEAIKAYKEAIRVNPDFAEAYYKLGISCLARNLPEEAIIAYKEVLRIHPGHAEAYNNLGTAFLRKGLNDEAISAYGKAVAFKPGYAEAYYNLGFAFIKKDMPAEAINSFGEFIKYAPSHDSRLAKAKELMVKLKLH